MMQRSDLEKSLHKRDLGQSYRTINNDDNMLAKFVTESLETVMIDSEFFRTAFPKLPNFSGDHEVRWGLLLGSGEFGMVHAVESLRLQVKAEDNIEGCEDREEAHRQQEYMATHVHRGGTARYVIKRLRKFEEDPYTTRSAAAVDIVSEALILANIKHTSIVTIRATVGTPGKSDYGIILDRLEFTLKQKIKDWAEAKKLAKGGILQRLVRATDASQSGCLTFLDGIHSGRLMAVYDIARALQYLHDRRLVFRDLKPDNVGVNLRGDYMLFDFGLAKELKKKDLVQAPDSFKATGLTGSRRYMAPEVVLSDNYGFSVDVYSFGLVFWETMALKIPYGKGLSVAKHFQEVVQQGRRPDTSKTRKIISPRLQSVMEACWSSPSTRPNFDAICEDLRAEIACGGAGDRTSHLFDKSINSKAGLD